ncbi:MAG: Tol-Pal system protein TolB, partial [Pseudomonadota bacterium]|nr:Tol-Pal system protein TolB [Pseudomonadota bacterium]
MVLYFFRHPIAARRVSKFLAMLAAAMLVAQSAAAQLRIEITEGMVAPTPIAIADFTGSDGKANDAGREIASIISNDLLSSGLFDPVDSAAFIAPPSSPGIKPNFANWTPLGVKGLLVGSAINDDEGNLRIEFVLWDVVTGRDLSSGTGTADPNSLRQL